MGREPTFWLNLALTALALPLAGVFTGGMVAAAERRNYGTMAFCGLYICALVASVVFLWRVGLP